jgi:ribosomal protein S18 acetylase RimI-like enzyme
VSEPLAEIRAARPEEYDAVGQLTLTAYRLGAVDADDGYAPILLDAPRRAEEAELYVGIDPDGSLVATVTLAAAGTEWSEVARDGEIEVRMLAVDPNAWGRGIGAAMMRWVIATARERGYAAIVLLVIEDNPAAHRLYQNLGFQRQPDRDWRPWPELLLMAYTLSLR